MAILLSDARQYCADVAYDMADEKADRLINRCIAQAIERLWREHTWLHYYATTRITLTPEVTGTDLDVTEGSSSISRDSAWSTDYVTQAWDLIIAEDGAKVYSISAVGSPTTNATLGTGEVWTGETGTNLSYTLSRYRYPVPDDFIRRAELVQELESWGELRYLTPAEFDYQRHTYPGRRGSRPEYYTLRGTAAGLSIDFYPAAGDDYRTVQITYTRKPTLPEEDDAGATEVDWPEEYRNLLWLAIEVEVARIQGEAAQVPYALCKPELNEALRSAKALETDKGHQRRTMGLKLGHRPAWPRNVNANFPEE
jgi:hypothetical protein